MTAAGLLGAVTRRFTADEMLVRAGRTTRLNVAAAGTLATPSLGSPLLEDACRAAGIRIGDRTARADLDGLLAAADWDLALVLSPFKGQAAGRCDRLAPRAAATGVVDTLVRAGGEQDDERPLDVPLAAALQPGTRVFDLTNRLSALQRQALAAGCVTMSGNLMQLLTNTLRAALASAR